MLNSGEEMTAKSLLENGEPGWVRTIDPLIKSPETTLHLQRRLAISAVGFARGKPPNSAASAKLLSLYMEV